MRIEDLRPNPENPREIKSKAKTGLRRSLEKYGDLSGITYNQRTERLVCGHQRVEQLIGMGGRYEGEAIWVGKHSYAVRVVDWDEDFEREANVAANNGEIQGEWSESIGAFLRMIKISMPEEEFSELRFDSLADKLRIDLEMPDELVEPPAPPLPKDPVTKEGDIWVLGDHRLVCGNALEEHNYPSKVSLWITDPPYNVGYVGKTKDALTIENDEMSDEDFRQFLTLSFSQAFDSMSPGASFYIWHADSEGYNFRGAVVDCKQKVRQCLIWKKNVLVMGRQDYQWMHEPCLYGWKSGAAHGWQSDRRQTTILEFERPSRSEEHPTMKPVALFAYLIKNSSGPDAVVLDNFAGSGTAILACEQGGRRCHSIELDPRYCDVIVQRWEELTGGSAKKE